MSLNKLLGQKGNFFCLCDETCIPGQLRDLLWLNLSLFVSGLPTEVHFDDDETFTTGTSGGINLDWAALHEFGHNLGLKHSNIRESVMYPWYKGYIPNIKLSNYDIHELQALYGE